MVCCIKVVSCKTSAPFSCGKAATKVAGEWPWLCCWELDPPALSCRWCSGACVVGTARATGIGAHCRAGGVADAVVSTDVWCKVPCLQLSNTR